MSNGRRSRFARRGVLTIHPQLVLSITDGSGSLPRTGLLTDVFETDSGTTSLLTTSPAPSESNPHRPIKTDAEDRGSRWEPTDQRFWRRVNKTETCWLWKGYRNEYGYGRFAFGNKTLYAHRFAYELLVAPIPEGLQIDHLCRVRHCVNPDHLEAVPQSVNILRGTGPAARNHDATECTHGHPFDEDNTYIRPNGSRSCKQCHRLTVRRASGRWCWCGGIRGAGKPVYDAGTWHRFDGWPCKGSYTDGER
jgi:hypothetical protein